MSHLIEHAKHELKLAQANEAGYGELLPNAVLELIEVFAKQNHSGMSASIVIELFTKLASFKILTPLTGEDHEWCEVSEGVFQNNRLAHVFKENGQSYDIDGKVFENSDGLRYTNTASRINIEFPYMPNREIVKVDK